MDNRAINEEFLLVYFIRYPLNILTIIPKLQCITLHVNTLRYHDDYTETHETIFRIVKTLTELYDLNNMSLHIKIDEYSFQPYTCRKFLMNKIDTIFKCHNIVI